MRLTRQAEEDLIAIWLFIGHANPAAADRMLDRIDERLRLLGDFPLAGPAVPDLGDELRQLVVAPYLAIYRVEEAEAVVLRILHGHRDLKAVDFG